MARKSEPILSRASIPALIAAGAAFLTLLLFAWGGLHRTDLLLYDLRARGNPASEVNERIQPVPIDDASTERIGRWPWPRAVAAKLARDLGDAGARVVLMDMTYSDPTPGEYGPAEDAEFVDVMRSAPATVFAYSVLGFASPLEELTEDRKVALAAFERRIPLAIEGADELLPDAPLASRIYLPISPLVLEGPAMAPSTLDSRVDDDGVVRRMALLFRYVPAPQSPNLSGDRRWLPSLTLTMACRWYDVDPATVRVLPGRVVLPRAAAPGEKPHDVSIPVDQAGRMLVRYAVSGVLASRFQSAFAMKNELAGDARGRHTVKDRAVLIYSSYLGGGDLHSTPLTKEYPGGLINGEALNTIVTGQFIYVPPWWLNFVLVIVEGALLVGFAVRWTSYRFSIAWLFLVLGVFVVGFGLYRATGIMLTLAPLAVFALFAGAGVVVYRTALEDRERVDLMFTLRALQNQALKERKVAEANPTTLRGSTGASSEATDALRRNVEYGRFIESLRDIENLENTYIGKHYRLLNLIDEGGMGLVFRAYDEALDRVVAIKVLTRYSAKLLKRFQVEAKAVGQIQHPNVVQVHAVASEGDIPYIVMEYVKGTSLSQRIRDDGPLPIVQAVEVILQVARGLDAAHVRQIIHRDIKTSNVLMTPDGTAKIIDFGIAKFFKASHDESGEGLTGDKEVVGTADYMSPEQGSGRQVDARSDIYSLGITLYRVLTGRLPFRAEDTVAVLLKQMRDPLPDILLTRPDVPAPVIEIMHRMVEKKPEARYQNCQSLSVDLEAFLHHARARDVANLKSV